MFFKTGVLKNFPNFTGKNMSWSLFITKLQDFRPANLLKRDSNTDVLLQKLGNFSEHLFLQNTSGGFCLLSINVHKQSMFFLMTPKNQFCNKGIFTLFVDDNIKKSNSSVEANNNFPWDSYVYYKVSHFRTFWLKASRRKIIN